MTSGPDVEANLATVDRLAARAAADGCGLLVLPENAAWMGPDRDRPRVMEPLDGPLMRRLGSVASRYGLWLCVGGVAETAPDGRAYNTSVMLEPSGAIAGAYRKMHLFDVQVDAENTFRESAGTCPGPATPVVVDAAGWRIGLSICYDLRFPELYRALCSAGAEALLVPAAFTVPTGAAHWHVLLRARAIENLAWVAAPAQVGVSYGQRTSFGHALMVSPWGEVRAEVQGGEGLAVAVWDPMEQAEARRRLPVWEHRRLPG